MGKITSRSSAQVAVAMVDYEVEDAYRTLQRAQEIESNPKLMAKLKVFAKDKLLQTAKVAAEINGDDA